MHAMVELKVIQCCRQNASRNGGTLNAKISIQYGADKVQEMVELKVIQKYVADKMQVE